MVPRARMPPPDPWPPLPPLPPLPPSPPRPPVARLPWTIRWSTVRVGRRVGVGLATPELMAPPLPATAFAAGAAVTAAAAGAADALVAGERRVLDDQGRAGSGDEVAVAQVGGGAARAEAAVAAALGGAAVGAVAAVGEVAGE